MLYIQYFIFYVKILWLVTKISSIRIIVQDHCAKLVSKRVCINEYDDALCKELSIMNFE